jgi:hypothetical protein
MQRLEQVQVRVLRRIVGLNSHIPDDVLRMELGCRSYPELSLSREGDMLSAGAHTQAIYKECNMSPAGSGVCPGFGLLGRDPQS